jgi:quercetin dioxygenase-like cupin family protein
MINPGEIYVGSADLEAPKEHGWLLGHFLPPDDPRHSDEVEIKWGRHPAGDRRSAWVHGEHRTAILFLISGRFTLEFPGREVTLSTPGEYVMWGVGVDHSWHADEESVVLTVRWPSVPGYKVPPYAGAP